MASDEEALRGGWYGPLHAEYRPRDRQRRTRVLWSHLRHLAALEELFAGASEELTLSVPASRGIATVLYSLHQALIPLCMTHGPTITVPPKKR